MLREMRGREGRAGRTHLSSIAAALGDVLSGHAVSALEFAMAQGSGGLHGFSGWSSGGWH